MSCSSRLTAIGLALCTFVSSATLQAAAAGGGSLLGLGPVNDGGALNASGVGTSFNATAMGSSLLSHDNNAWLRIDSTESSASAMSQFQFDNLPAMPDLFSRPASLTDLSLRFHISPIKSAAMMEAKQLIQGKLQSVRSGIATLTTATGNKNLKASADQSATLDAVVGQNIAIRSVDGSNISSIVTPHEAVRGTVMAIAGDVVALVRPNGEVHTVVLAPGAVSKIGVTVGSNGLLTSDNSEQSVSFAVLAFPPSSTLNNVYVGTVGSISNGSVQLQMGSASQSFAVDAATAKLLARRQGTQVALNAADGMHVTTLIPAGILEQLVANAKGQTQSTGRIPAEITAISENKITLQLPNGDVATYIASTPIAKSETGLIATLKPLDFVHARITAGSQTTQAVDAAFCGALNDDCSEQSQARSSGRVLSVSPMSVTVRMANGDVQTLLGNVAPIAPAINMPVSLQAVGGPHVRVTHRSQVANLIDANACATINSGCDEMTGTVTSVSATGAVVALANGGELTLSGSTDAAGLAQSTLVLVQQLDGERAMVLGHNFVGSFVTKNACAGTGIGCKSSKHAGIVTASNSKNNPGSARPSSSRNTSEVDVHEVPTQITPVSTQACSLWSPRRRPADRTASLRSSCAMKQRMKPYRALAWC